MKSFYLGSILTAFVFTITGISNSLFAQGADICGAAAVVSDGAHAIDNTAATGTDITSCTFNDNLDVWWEYVATGTGTAQAETCGSAFDTGLSIWTACGGTELGCNDDDCGAGGAAVCGCGVVSSVQWAVTAGTSYWIRVAGYNGGSGLGTLTLSCPGCAVSGGSDNCVGAGVVSDGAHPINNTAATGTDITSCTFNDNLDVWWEYVATGTGTAQAETCGSAFDTGLSVWDACGGTELACNDDDCGAGGAAVCGCGTVSSVQWAVTQGNSYWVRVAGYNGSSGLGTLTLSCPGCAVIPTILVPIAGNNTVSCGTDVTLRDHNDLANYADFANGYTVLQAAGAAVINISGPYDTENGFDNIRIYDGTGVGGTLLTTLTGVGTANYTGTAGQTLTVEFTSDVSINAPGFDFSVTYTGSCILLGADDDCALAPVVGNGVHPFDNTVATGINETSCAGTGDVNDVWYEYVATATGTANASTCNDATFDTSIGIFDGCGGTELACNDDFGGCAGNTSSVDFAVITGNSYWVRMAGFGGATGTGNVTLSCAGCIPTYPLGTCAQGLAITDNQCPVTDDLAFGPAAAPGTALGVDVYVQSVDLIIDHTWTGDLDIRLSSPSGIQVDLALINTNGYWGNVDDLGDPTNCPTDVFRLQDGGTLLSAGIPASPVVGTFAPEESLMNFNDGTDPNGFWTLNICDGAGLDLGSVEYMQINFGTFTTYYSQASGNVSDPIWDVVPVGVGGPAAFDRTTNMVVQTGDNVVQDAVKTTVYDFTLQNGATYIPINLTDTLLSHNDLVILDPGFGPIVLEWDAWHQPSVNTTVEVFVTSGVSNGAGVVFFGPKLTVKEELHINSGDFDMAGNVLVLDSDINGTARIGDLSNGTLSNVAATKMRRYIPGGVTNWRNLGTPVIGKHLEHWDWDFVTSGIPNSDYPNFTDDNGDIWPSIYQYDQTLAAAALGGPAIDTGFVAPGDMNDLFISGAGYWVWCGDQLGGTAPFTIDVVGTPNVGPQALPLPNNMPLTPTAPELANLGWNMVSNPLPSPVDFSGIALAGNIENRYWIYDPVTGNTALWDEATLTSIPALILNGNIQSSQGMWMHSFDQGPISAVVPETAKVSDAAANGVFGGFAGNTDPEFRLEISTTMNSRIDEVLVRFTPNGNPGVDQGDACKLFYSFPDAAMISSRSADDIDLIMNDMGTINTSLEIPVSVKTPLDGDYTLRLYDLVDPSSFATFILEDLQTGTITPITEGATYTFTAAQGDMDPRFLIHVLQPSVSVSVKALLEGPYDVGAGLMNDDLRSAGHLPTSEPFTALGFVQVNGGGETIDDGVLNVTGNDAIVDWVLVELRDQNNNSFIVSTASALVQRDGDVVAMDGVSPVEVYGEDDEYFVSIRHRNHLGVMAMNSFFLNDTPAQIDLSDGTVATYGTEAQKTLNGGTKVLWSGNVFPDASIKYTGNDNDRDPILIAIGGAVPTNTISGYYLEDVDMDGVVKYTGLNNDRDPILINIGGAVPTNVRAEQLP